MTTLYLREIETTVRSYELVETNSSHATYVERDKHGASVASIPTSKPSIKIIAEWRPANDIEKAIFDRCEGV